jgi:hypothetical protein
MVCLEGEKSQENEGAIDYATRTGSGLLKLCVAVLVNFWTVLNYRSGRLVFYGSGLTRLGLLDYLDGPIVYI